MSMGTGWGTTSTTGSSWSEVTGVTEFEESDGVADEWEVIGGMTKTGSGLVGGLWEWWGWCTGVEVDRRDEIIM